MEVTKEIIDNLPQNILYSSKERKHIKQFYKELRLLINEKANKKESLVNVKQDIYMLIKNIFPNIYQHFYYQNNINSLEIFIFCLCNQLESQFSKMVEGYRSFDFNSSNDSENKNKICSFLISFYDFFEDELVINNEDIINTVIEANDTREKNSTDIINKKEEINNSFILSILKIINKLDDLSLSNDEFKKIFTEGVKSPSSNYYCLNDMGFLLIKILESIIKIEELSSINFRSSINKNMNVNIDKNLAKFIQICYWNIVPTLMKFFIKIILNYNLNNTFNIILKKKEFITLYGKLSSKKELRQRLLFILIIIKNIYKPEQENYCKNMILKNRILDKIIKYINNDVNNENRNIYYNTKEVLSEIKLILIYFSNNNSFPSNYEELCLLINNILNKFSTIDKNCKNSFNIFFDELNAHIKKLNIEDDNKYKIYNFMLSLIQNCPSLSNQIAKVVLDEFKNNAELYQDMIGKTSFFNSFVINLHKFDKETIDYFFGFLIGLYKNFHYLPNIELTNILNSLTFFTDEKSVESLIQNLKEFNTQVKNKKRLKSMHQNKRFSINLNRRKSSANINQGITEEEPIDFFEEINQNFIDIVLNIINDIISQNKDIDNSNNTLMKPEMLYHIFDYIQEIIKSDTIYQYFSSKKFDSLFHSLVCIQNYQNIAYKIIEVFLRSSKDKEHNEALIKLILNRLISTIDVVGKDEQKLFIIEINKIRELLLMLKTLKVTFLKEALSEKSSQKNMNEKIVSFVLKYIDYINENKKNIFKVYNPGFHLNFKKYLDVLFELVIISNENVINNQNGLSPKLNYQNLNKIIYKTLLFFKELKIIQQNNNNNINNNININENISKAISADINHLSNNNKTENNKIENINKCISADVDFNNSNDYLLDIIKYFIDKSLNINYNINNQNESLINKKFDEYYINKYKISKIIFDTNKNKNILSNFILQSPTIIILLLNILYKLDIYLELFFDFIYLLCITNENNIIYLLRQGILKILLDISSNSVKYNFIILKILNWCFKFLRKEELKEVFEYLIKMFNNNNHAFTKDIIKSLNNSFNLLTSTDYDYCKGIILSNYFIKQPNSYNLININNINLTTKPDNNIIIKEEVYFYSSINTNQKLILLKLENEFFGGNKSKQFLEISLYNYDISVIENNQNSFNNSDKKEANISLNAKEFINLNDVNIFNYLFNISENKLIINVNGKNMYSYEYSFNFPNIENKKGNKYNNNSIFATLGYPLESIKEAEDKTFFIYPHIKLISLYIKIENESKEKTNIYKMNINDIKLINKPYDNLTNFKLDEDTMLISKYNSYESVKINSVYYENNLKIILYNNIFFINTYLSYSFDYTFRLEKYLFILLNSLNLDKDLFKLLINLLCSYFMINRKYLPKFLAKEEINASLYFIIYKNAHFIDKSIIEIILPSLLSYDKLNSTIVTDILLDYKIFQKINLEAKKELLSLIDRKLLIDDYNLEVLLFEKLTNLLILCYNDSINNNSNNNSVNNENSIDEIIIDIICKIITKNSKNQLFINKVKDIFYILFNFHKLVKEHVITYNKGRPKDTYQIISNFFKKMFMNDCTKIIKDCFTKIINSKMNLDKYIKNILIGLCNRYNPKDNNYFSFKEGENDFEMKVKESKNNLFFDNQDHSFDDKKYNKDNIRKKSLKIFRKDESEEISNQIIRKSKKRKTEKEDNSFSIKGIIGGRNDSWVYSQKLNCVSVKINLGNNEIIDCNGDCQLCKYIRSITKDLFLREIKFNVFEKYMLNNYTETYMFNKNLDYNLYFSYYLMKKEGISRIRKNFQLKVDKITNIEIDRSTEEIKNNSKKNDLQKLFNFYRNKRVSQCLCDMFNLAQIFDIELITECIDDTDSFKNCFNCLLFEGLNYINSVLILGREKIYILTSVNISKDYMLYSAINPIPRTFWVLENYNNLLLDQCKYLEMYDYMNGIKIKIRKSVIDEEKANINSEIFQKQEKGFQIFSFNYREINELHKKRFLHQNNAIEIFLKNGKNYYLAFNIDLRDVIVGKIIQNLIDTQNSRNKNLIINKLLSNNNEYNINSNISNGGSNTPDINSIQNSNDNGYLFEINNNSLSTVKNENMIFIRNINLFIEKEKSQSLKNYYKSKSKSKGKKNYCKITDIKEILDQALEKWSNGFLNTFSYIMILNTLSGRTFNNLAQYPVFPWILQDYSENEIDLNAPETFRDLSYPIYAQDAASRDNLKEKYESFDDNDLKYHCGSHYSNCGFVCYYLVRIKPFSNIAAEIQGNCFDTPDRLFFNIQKFYIVKEKYQELIPDVFYLPELYININNYVYGKTTDNLQVLDVILPKWAVNSPRLFSKMNKKAIESQFVSQHINDWIDLIFGYKRSGSEAEKSYNVLKNIFSGFDPKKEEEGIIEGKINELCEMGIDPIQLFKKEHPKRDKHQTNKAFLGRYKLLQCFEPTDSYQIKNFHSSSKIKEIYAYYENNGILSHGEGGLSSFRMIYENDTTFLKGKANDNKDSNIYFIVGEKKTLMPPSYKNFIEWGDKNIFSIVKPFQNKKYTFKIKHMKKFNINCIKISSNGKYIVLGYDNGVLEKYKLKKVNNCYIEEIINVYNKMEINAITRAETAQEIESKISKKKKNQSKGKKILQKLFPFKKAAKNSEKDERYNNISSNSFHNPKFEDKNNLNTLTKNDNSKENQVKMIVKNHIIFNPQLSMSQSNILNSECFLLNQKNEKFIQYNSVPNEIYPNSSNEKDIEGYYCHSKSSSVIKHLSKKSSNNDNSQKGYVIFLCNSSYNILSEVCLIDICDSYSFMLVVDKMNKLYLYNFKSFQLLRYIDISSMFTNQIKFSSICPYTGDFIVSSSKNVVLMSINGVFLSQINSFQSKISSCFISIIPMTESDLFLFTGHKDGNLIISKLVNNSNSLMMNASRLNPSNSNETINPVNKVYHEAYNAIENNYKKYLNKNNLTLIFDTVISIDCSENPIRYIKLKEDLTEIICIDNKNKIIYITYEKFFTERKEKSNQKNSKNCPMCKSAISSSKILCHLCGKKLCSNCKVEKILPEYSFKNPKAICEECLQFINSTNKMLYDF